MSIAQQVCPLVFFPSNGVCISCPRAVGPLVGCEICNSGFECNSCTKLFWFSILFIISILKMPIYNKLWLINFGGFEFVIL